MVACALVRPRELICKQAKQCFLGRLFVFE